MRKDKVHVYGGIKTYYTKSGKKWIVEDGDKKVVFDDITSLTDKYPLLKAIPAVQRAISRKAFADKEVPLNPNKDHFRVISKVVICYYCSGKGELESGIPCTNCNGKGKFEVSTRGFD